MEEHQELSDQEMEADFEVLDAAIDFKLKGFYPEVLSKNQKRLARRSSQRSLVLVERYNC